MIYKSRKLSLGEHEVILRSATLDDAEIIKFTSWSRKDNFIYIFLIQEGVCL